MNNLCFDCNELICTCSLINNCSNDLNLTSELIDTCFNKENTFSNLKQTNPKNSSPKPDTSNEIKQNICKSNLGLMKKGLHFINLNVCHIMPKLDELVLYLQEQLYTDIFSLCETFLDENINDCSINIKGYCLERKDRVGKAGGGLVTYISNDLKYKRRTD